MNIQTALKHKQTELAQRPKSPQGRILEHAMDKRWRTISDFAGPLDMHPDTVQRALSQLCRERRMAKHTGKNIVLPRMWRLREDL